MNKKLLSLLFLATPFLTFAQEKGLDQKIDEAFGNATGWFVDIIFYQIPFTDTVSIYWVLFPLILGATFKENCPDVRNTRVIDIVKELKEYNIIVDINDPWCNADEVAHEYGLSLTDEPKHNHYDAVILAVAHQQFKELGAENIRAFGKTQKHVLYDLKYILPKEEVCIRL